MKKELTAANVYDVLTFANELLNNNVFGYYSPYIQNQQLRDLNNRQVVATYDDINTAIQSVQENASQLQAYSEFLEVADMIYKRTLEYYANMLSFDMTISCTNAYGDDYRSEAYKEDLKRVYKFLNAFDYKNEFRIVVKELLRHETYFTWFRTNMNENKPAYTLQMMPQNKCIISGYWQGGLLYDFDMNYFFKPGTDINLFDPIFKEYYLQVFGATPTEKYIPSSPLGDRRGNFETWVQTSPDNGAWAFKMNRTNFNAVPFLTGLMGSAVLNNEIQKLQRDKDILGAYVLLIGEMRMFDNAKSGTTKNQFAVDPKTLGQFLSLLQSGLNKNVKVGVMPAEEVEWRQFEDKNADMYSNQLSSMAGVGAGASSILYSTSKLSQTETYAAITADYNMVRAMYPQFANMLNFYINKKTRRFKFKVTFDGSTYWFEREQRMKNLLGYADRGIVLNSSAFASAMGIEPQCFDAMLDEGHNSEFVDKLSMLMSIHTQSDKQQGAPKKEQIADTTEESADAT